MGSSVFFSGFDDYQGHDVDYLYIADELTLSKENSIRIKIKNDDAIIYRQLTKDEFIQDALDSELPMKVGKFLVPEFAEYIGLTIDDLQILKPVINKIDDKHKYEKTIYNAYIKNGDFVLTDSQLKRAYKIYKDERI